MGSAGRAMGRYEASGADPAVLADVDGDAVGADVLSLEVLVAERYVREPLGAERVELAVGGLGILDHEAEVAHATLELAGLPLQGDAQHGEVGIAVGEVDAGGGEPGLGQPE